MRWLVVFSCSIEDTTLSPFRNTHTHRLQPLRNSTDANLVQLDISRAWLVFISTTPRWQQEHEMCVLTPVQPFRLVLIFSFCNTSSFRKLYIVLLNVIKCTEVGRKLGFYIFYIYVVIFFLYIFVHPSITLKSFNIYFVFVVVSCYRAQELKSTKEHNQAENGDMWWPKDFHPFMGFMNKLIWLVSSRKYNQ